MRDRLAEVSGKLVTPAFPPGHAPAGVRFEPYRGPILTVVMKAGDKVGFAWSITIEQQPLIQFWVRFNDDAGVPWEINTDLHVQKLASRDW